jgi:hypothetical protein
MLRAIVQRSLRNLVYRAEYRIVPPVNSKSRYPPLIELNRKMESNSLIPEFGLFPHIRLGKLVE